MMPDLSCSDLSWKTSIYIPKIPNQSELNNVFDISFVNIQPYLFQIHYQMSNKVTTSVGTTMRKLIQDDTLSL